MTVGAFEDKLGCPFCRDHDLPPSPALERAWRLHRERHEIGEVERAREDLLEAAFGHNRSVRRDTADELAKSIRTGWMSPEDAHLLLDPPYSFEDTFEGLFREAFDLLVSKQRDYGPGNIDAQGEWGIFKRISADKMARIGRAFHGTVVGGVEDVKMEDYVDGESVEQDILDVMNYCAILLAKRRGVWGRPLREEMDA